MKKLTNEQIADIDSQQITAGDWALISLKPFESEETLTVMMKDGEEFTIRVTDAQISTNVLTADGKTYTITVAFNDDVEIPVGTKLSAFCCYHSFNNWFVYISALRYYNYIAIFWGIIPTHYD